mgnify:CR=1 FL=1
MKLNSHFSFEAAALVLAAGLAITGCQPESKDLGEAGLSGQYHLASVDGKTLPANISHGKDAVLVRSGTFTFNPDGTCSTHTVFAPSSGAEVKRDVSATYSREGTNVFMRWKGAGKTAGTLADDTFTMNNEGLLFVYRK